MLEYIKINTSEGIDVVYVGCSLCKFYYFLVKNFKYGPYLCDGCYDMSIKEVSI